MSDVRPYPPWWQDRYDALDDRDLGYDPRDDPLADDFVPWVDVDGPAIACQWDERDGDDF